jgi:succinate dehydrogenase / fumarate reductase flavoprotein subunit
MVTLNSATPEGPLADKWANYKQSMKLVNPANRRKYDILIVGSGLAGASAAASLGELGYNVKCFCFPGQSTPGPQYCRPGWNQCRQELQERWR